MQIAIKELAAAVVEQAFHDLRNRSTRTAAMRFINSKDFEFWTGILQVSPDMLREKATTIPVKQQRKKIS